MPSPRDFLISASVTTISCPCVALVISDHFTLIVVRKKKFYPCSAEARSLSPMVKERSNERQRQVLHADAKGFAVPL
ncbi:hypothetical protein, partial [Bradyrhizobium sp. JYMT SZCCT0428]|uniref:hypothetical protein n=1 Tax=Bradyrhizobium sp. JYMT SZCCT0428 TaxID=2807673 RepID=UPI001BAABE0E